MTETELAAQELYAIESYKDRINRFTVKVMQATHRYISPRLTAGSPSGYPEVSFFPLFLGRRVSSDYTRKPSAASPQLITEERYIIDHDYIVKALLLCVWVLAAAPEIRTTKARKAGNGDGLSLPLQS